VFKVVQEECTSRLP